MALAHLLVLLSLVVTVLSVRCVALPVTPALVNNDGNIKKYLQCLADLGRDNLPLGLKDGKLSALQYDNIQ